MKLIVLVLILISFAASGFALVILDHQAPIQLTPTSMPKLELEVKLGFTQIQEAYIYYREIKTEAFKQDRLSGATDANPIYTYQLPALPANSEGYEYYFEVVRTDGQTQTMPEISPLRDPYRLMQGDINGGNMGFVVLSPLDTNVNSGDDLVLAVSTYALGDKLDQSSIRIIENGVDVTPYAEITNNLIIYRHIKPKSGNLSIQITGRLKDGSEVASAPMRYTVKQGAKLVNLPFNLRGNISFNSDVISVSAKKQASVSGTATDDASTNINLYGSQGFFKINSKLFLSTLESDKKQPINRYNLGLNLPGTEIILGDNTPFFSSLTMNSTNVRGLYAKFFSKSFAILGLYGQSKRAIDGNEIENAPVMSQTATPGTFSRDAAGMRMEFGSVKSFKWSFDFVRSRDIVSSLKQQFYRYQNTDTTFAQISFPVDNLVFGTDMRLSLFRQSFIMGLEGAGSMYNTNILPGPISDEDFEDYTGNKPPAGISASDFQDIFILNKNLNWFKPSLACLAMQGYARLFMYKNYLSLSYSQVGSSFQSVAASYLQNDTRSINVSDNVNIKNIVFLDGGVNIISDNLSKQKAATSTYTNWYAQTLFRMINLPYLRIGYHANTGKNKENTDINSSTFYPMNTESNMVDVGLGYDFVMMPVAPTKLDLTYNTNTNQDKQNSAYELNMDNVLLTLTSRFQQLPLTTRISFNVGNQDNKYGTITKELNKVKNSNTEFGLHGEYRLLYDKLIPYADFKTTVLGGDQQNQSYQFFNVGARYMPLEQTSIMSSLGFKNYANSDYSSSNYNSVTWNLNISQRF